MGSKRLAFALLGLVAIALPVAAQSILASFFNIVFSVTSTCKVFGPTNGAAIPDLTISYISRQATPASASSTFNVLCSNGTPYTLSLDSTAVTDSALNLSYVLALSANMGVGNGANQAYTINAVVAPGQTGACTSGACSNSAATNRQRVLTLTY